MVKKLTIDDLGAMVARGFADLGKRVTTKEDLKELATKEQLRKLEQKTEDGFQHVISRLDALREDISDLPAMREELRDLGRRVERLEQEQRLRK